MRKRSHGDVPTTGFTDDITCRIDVMAGSCFSGGPATPGFSHIPETGLTGEMQVGIIETGLRGDVFRLTSFGEIPQTGLACDIWCGIMETTLCREMRTLVQCGIMEGGLHGDMPMSLQCGIMETGLVGDMHGGIFGDMPGTAVFAHI